MQLVDNLNKKIPNRYKRFPIFADCETFIKCNLDGYRFEPNEDKSLIIRDECDIIPWLFCYSFPVINEEFGKVIEWKPRQYKFNFCKEDSKQFFEDLVRLKKCNMIAEVWFHNTTYDFTSLLVPCWGNVDPDLEFDDWVKDSNLDFICGTVYSPKYDVFIILRDTMMYQRKSLKYFGELLSKEKEESLKKGEVFLSLGATKEWPFQIDPNTGIIECLNAENGEPLRLPLMQYTNYCIRDVEITEQIYKYNNERIDNTYTELLGKKPKRRPNTQGNLSKEIAKEKLKKEYWIDYNMLYRYTISEEEYEKQRNSCIGGFTARTLLHQQYVRENNEIIGSFDVNSMYPSIIVSGLPAGIPLDFKPLCPHVEWVEISCTNVNWTEKYSHISQVPIPLKLWSHEEHNIETKFYIPREILTFLEETTTIEYTEHNVIYQEIRHELSKVLKGLYDQRNNIRAQMKELALEQSKVEKNSERWKEINNLIRKLDNNQENIKTVANSKYGKLIEKTHEKITKYEGIFGFTTHPKPKEQIEYQAMLSGAYISWMGRFTIYQKIIEIIDLGYKFLYCDTDSVKFAYPKELNIDTLFEISKTKLGAWKHEGEFDEFASHCHKKYMLINYDPTKESVIRLSGIPDEWTNRFKHGLKTNMKETLEHLRTIYSTKHSVLIKEAKNQSIKTKKYNQTAIHKVDIKTNSRIKHNMAVCVKKGELEYEWIWQN